MLHPNHVSVVCALVAYIPCHVALPLKISSSTDMLLRIMDAYSTQRFISMGYKEGQLPHVISNHPAAMYGYSIGVAVLWAVIARHKGWLGFGGRLAQTVDIGAESYVVPFNLDISRRIPVPVTTR